ncbi:MAG: hypothetical protein JSV02_09155 [Dehalococcoidia bacterium]|nr:MAG: hypothetical protein JSV02_09155 [Dehalococcoidia bacterium]
MKRSKWLLETCAVCGAKYSVWSGDLKSDQTDHLCHRCRQGTNRPAKSDKERELVQQL